MAFSLIIPFTISDLGGNLATGVDVSDASLIRICTNGGAIANRTGAAPAEVGGGLYAYTCAVGEIPASGFVMLLQNIDPGSYKPQWWRADVGLLSYALRTGRTVLGLLRRLDALTGGKATGLNGAAPTFFQPDGATTEFSNTQNLAAGTRGTATVTNSETP